jgi:hypothetical protein
VLGGQIAPELQVVQVVHMTEMLQTQEDARTKKDKGLQLLSGHGASRFYYILQLY